MIYKREVEKDNIQQKKLTTLIRKANLILEFNKVFADQIIKNEQKQFFSEKKKKSW